MAHMHLSLLIVVVAVAFSNACWPWQNGGWQINDRTSVGPAVSPNGGIGIEFRHQFRRDVSSASPEEVFKSVDSSHDGFITADEWVVADGSRRNFMSILSAEDTDGDERMSFEEFTRAIYGDEYKTGDSKE